MRPTTGGVRDECATAFFRDNPASERMHPRKHRILIVEDHPDVAMSLAEVLRCADRAGRLEVATVATVAAARSALARGPWDLILSDLGLPDGEGIEVLEEARRRDPRAALALMTGQCLARDLLGRLDALEATLLEKPFHARDLFALVPLAPPARARPAATMPLAAPSPPVRGAPA